MVLLDRARLRTALVEIRAEADAERKGRQLESLVGHVLGCVPGLTLDAADVVNRYHSEEIDLIFWNEQLREGLHFLDCPLIVECKGWSRPLAGREVRYFADVLRDRGRRNGILVALNGITGDPDDLTAGFYHQAVSMVDGVQILVVTGEQLEALLHANDLVALLKRQLLEITKRQLLAIGPG